MMYLTFNANACNLSRDIITALQPDVASRIVAQMNTH